MKILLDENLPQKLVPALRAAGHEAESVLTLKLQGLDNGKLYRFALANFEICFTRDFGFANNARQGPPPANFKLLRVALPQKPQDLLVRDFMTAFSQTDWNKYPHGSDWP